CAEIRADGTLRRVGKAGGAPNGINMDARGRIVIANFGLGTAPTGPLQRLDPATGTVDILCGAIDGKPLVASNYPIVDRPGNLWLTLVIANKVVAITPKYQVVTLIHDPAGELMSWPTNVSWGGGDMRDLYVGTIRRDYVLRARSPVPGLSLVHQR